MLDRLHLGAARCTEIFHRFTGSVGFAVSHGRLPDASRSHGRATDPAFSSNTSLARAALIWSRIDVSAAAVACSADRTIALDDRKRIAPTPKIFFINADTKIPHTYRNTISFRLPYPNFHFVSIRRIFDGIGEKIDQHLADPVFVAIYMTLKIVEDIDVMF